MGLLFCLCSFSGRLAFLPFHPPREDQRLAHQLVIFRVFILHQRPLHCLLVRVARDIDRLHRPRIETGIVHHGRERGRRRVEILYLLWLMVDVAQIFRQLHGLCHRAARM